MRREKFIVTKELGKLAKWLRILGYDSEYFREPDAAGIIISALREQRIILTRSPAMTKYKGVRVVIVRHDLVEDQLDQVKNELGLSVEEDALFRRCVDCNAALEDCGREEVRDKVPEYVYKTQEVFKRCPQCGKVFWKGTHWDMVKGWLEGEKGKA